MRSSQQVSSSRGDRQGSHRRVPGSRVRGWGGTSRGEKLPLALLLSLVATHHRHIRIWPLALSMADLLQRSTFSCVFTVHFCEAQGKGREGCHYSGPCPECEASLAISSGVLTPAWTRRTCHHTGSGPRARGQHCGGGLGDRERERVKTAIFLTNRRLINRSWCGH